MTQCRDIKSFRPSGGAGSATQDQRGVRDVIDARTAELFPGSRPGRRIGIEEAIVRVNLVSLKLVPVLVFFAQPVPIKLTLPEASRLSIFS